MDKCNTAVYKLFFQLSTAEAVFQDQSFKILSKATEQYLQGDIFRYIFIRKKRVIDRFLSSSSIVTEEQTLMFEQGEFPIRRLGGGRLNLPVLSCMVLCKAWGEVPCGLKQDVGVKSKSARTLLRRTKSKDCGPRIKHTIPIFACQSHW